MWPSLSVEFNFDPAYVHNNVDHLIVQRHSELYYTAYVLSGLAWRQKACPKVYLRVYKGLECSLQPLLQTTEVQSGCRLQSHDD